MKDGSHTITLPRGAVEPLGFKFRGRAFAARYLGEVAMANDYEQSVNWARIVVLAAASLPVFGGLYYALLDYLLFG